MTPRGCLRTGDTNSRPSQVRQSPGFGLIGLTQVAFERHGIVVIGVGRCIQHGNRTFLGHRTEVVNGFVLVVEFVVVPVDEFFPSVGIVVEPLAEIVTGATSFNPSSSWASSFETPRGHSRSTRTRVQSSVCGSS